MNVIDENLLNLSEYLLAKAGKNQDKVAYVFLADGESESSRLSYKDLCFKAKNIAVYLQKLGLSGERAALMYHSGPDYIIALWACFLADVLAIPVYPPRNSYHAQRLGNIMDDGQAKAILTTEESLKSIKSFFANKPQEQGLDGSVVSCKGLEYFIATDTIVSNCNLSWKAPSVTLSDIAYLQYTSGSTGTPKGVMVSHGNVVQNCELYAERARLAADKVHVNWLPIYHDMGLIQGVMLPFMLDCMCVVMPPVAFIQKPIRWLRAISQYSATFSGGPNFAYQLCVNKVDEGDLNDLDLSCWECAANGAEPILPATLESFTSKFADVGFRKEAHYPGYGMAETTLFVCAGGARREPNIKSFDKSALEQGRAVLSSDSNKRLTQLVGCGILQEDPQIIIVDPTTHKRCEENCIGEIWIAGRTVCKGYWEKPDVTEEAFRATLKNDADKTHYFRTGDLAFIHKGELFFASRLKELIIVRGTNHYPQDIEKLAQTAHGALNRGNTGAAFTVEDDGEQKLVLVQEIIRSQRKNFDSNEVAQSISQLIAEAHGIDIDTIVFINPASLPVTSSGKIQRTGCRQLFLDKQLKTLATWQRKDYLQSAPSLQAMQDRVTPATVEMWLKTVIASWIGCEISAVDIHVPLASYGLNSLRMVELAGELGEQLNRSLSPVLLYNYPTIAKLASYVCDGSSMDDLLYSERLSSEDIAIIGFDCRVPGANNVEAFWQTLLQGGDGISETPSTRWSNDTYYSASARAGKMNTRWGGYLDKVDEFDASLFDISRREAQSIDPQQRLLLEVAWTALENAGIAPDSLVGSQTGVFVGICSNDYATVKQRAGVGIDAYSGTGNALSIAANRLSYFYDLRGPSQAIDTACSSSLVAVHQACRSLRASESQLALVGGVNLILEPDNTIIFSQAQMMSPTGRCRTFSNNADGYVRSEGCALAILKRLADAERDGDNIVAVIKGSAINQDGRSNGLSAPNGQAQQQVIKQALVNAHMEASDIGMIEAHGTGTPLGDPIEVDSIQQVFDVNSRKKPLYVGAVKSNLGHLEAAAGIVGLIKAALVASRGVIPANLYMDTLNPKIKRDSSKIVFPSAQENWQDRVRIIGVSSFGFGGTNSHAIVQSYEMEAAEKNNEDKPTINDHYLLALSANSEQSLRNLSYKLIQHVDNDSVNLLNSCFSVNTTQAHLPYRTFIRGKTPVEMRKALQNCKIQRLSTNTSGKIVFLFPGQGCQYSGMAKTLYDSQPVFKIVIDQCNQLLKEDLDIPLVELLFNAEHSDLLDQTQYTQAVVFSVEYALALLWQSWGIQPDFLIGHSVGEYVAACVAGVFSLDDGLKMIAARGQLIHSCSPGAMLAVNATTEIVETILKKESSANAVDFAAYNGPDAIVLSGETDVIDRIKKQLSDKNILVNPLKVSHAFHSAMLEPILEPFKKVAESITYNKPQIPIISNLTGELADESIASPNYWVEHIRKPVKFAQGMNTLQQQGENIYLEVGPKPTLISMAQQYCDRGIWLTSLRPQVNDWEQLLDSLETLFTSGHAINFANFYQPYQPKRIPVPNYCFDRESYWVNQNYMVEHPIVYGLAGQVLKSAFDDRVCFESYLNSNNPSYLSDHRVFDQIIFPGAGYVELALAALYQADSSSHWRLETIAINEVLILEEDNDTTVHTYLHRDEDACFSAFTICSQSQEDDKWIVHASGSISISEPLVEGPLHNLHNLSDLSSGISSEAFYQKWQQRGLGYGPSFSLIEKLSVERTQLRAFAHVKTLADMERHTLHPALLDAAFQVAGSLLSDDFLLEGQLPLPVAIDSIQAFAEIKQPVIISVRQRQNVSAETKKEFMADIDILSEPGVTLAQINGLRLVGVKASRLFRKRSLSNMLYTMVWQTAENPIALPSADTSEKNIHWALVNVSHSNKAKETLHQVFDGFKAGTWVLGDVQKTVSPEDIASLSNFCVYMDLMSKDDLADFDNQLFQLFNMLKSLALKEESTQLVLVTTGAYSASQSSVGQAWLASTTSLLASYQNENPQVSCLHIDLCETTTEADIAQLKQVKDNLPREESVIRIGDGKLETLRVSRIQQRRLEQPSIKADAAYLITGGLGALGLETASVLINSGARHLVLVSRQPPPSHIEERIHGWRSDGVQVTIHTANIAVKKEVDALFENIRVRMPTLAGIVHAAGVLKDGLLSEQSWEDWYSVFAPKVNGAINLHLASKDLSLDFFTCYSSVASILGSPGQTNYAAANGFLDTLMHNRRQQGMAGTTINWGPWAEIGMAHRQNILSQINGQGVKPIALETGRQLIAAMAFSNAPQHLIIDVDWNRLVKYVPNIKVLTKNLLTAGAPGPTEVSVDLDALKDAIRRSEKSEAMDYIFDYLHGLLCVVCYYDKPRDEDLPYLAMGELGLDSLMAVEFRNRLLKQLSVKIPLNQLISDKTIGHTAELIYDDLFFQHMTRVGPSYGLDGNTEEMTL